MTNPLRPTVSFAFFSFSARFEGVVPHLYLDVLGLVTIGAGQLYRTPEEARSLPLRWPDGRLATPDEIVADWWRVHDDPTAARLGASRAAQVAQLRLAPADLRALFDQRRDQTAEALARRFPGFASFPASAQLGLMSLAWAAGSGFDYPRLAAAVLRQDWATCAAECAIRDNEPRSEAQRALFLAAAAVVASGAEAEDGVAVLVLHRVAIVRRQAADQLVLLLPGVEVGDVAVLDVALDLVGAHLQRGDLALGVAGGRREAEAGDGLVLLRQPHQEALHARGATDQDQQQAGRERVQRARVPDLRALRQPAPDPRHDVVRRDPRGLVDEEDSVLHLELLRELFPQERDELGEVQVRGEAGRAAVPAAASRPHA